ncbi:Ig-like domain-containing protein [Floccifex porci]|uniref:BIG2 domain-containing protein n=1 Tax=Floccifex porci TaxID=2606629 RepID=A0A7X2N287_9FIRM|nr:Ig-like domain-containing protein [Floccifex porci]MSS01076.1 hypothetical protein [Floccifex porci]
MKRRMKKLMSLLISVSMVFSVFTMPVYATPADGTESEQTVESETTETEDNTTGAAEETQPEETQPETTQPEETQPQTTTVEESFTTYTVNADDIDVSDVTTHGVVVDEEVVVDENDPIMTTVEEELGNIKVLNDDGEPVPLTEEQIQSLLYIYQQYQDQWADNKNILGVQLPFFLNYNEDSEDGLGVMGEMLVLAGYSVEDVRAGKYKYDELMGMVQNFLYADKYALKFYTSDIENSRAAVVKEVEKSGAKTLVQKMLVINDWIAHNTNFDMAYIMKDDDGNPIMVAEEPKEHEHYQDIYNDMYAMYKEQIKKQFHQAFYEGAIKQTVYSQALGKSEDDATDEEKQAASQYAEDYMTEQKEEISKDPEAFVESTFGSKAAEQFKAQEEVFMDTASDDLGGATPNQVVESGAQQGAEGLTNGIIGAWEGNHVGVLAEGIGVCAGYSKAFSYLLQYMSPEIYGVNGAGTDMSVSSNWKTAEELYYDEDGNLDITKGYLVDMVRITFDANVTMFGEESPFGEVHFWNAVQVKGQWYYVDPCYTDIYVECMSRDRVEIDGTMNHMYFMFSHSTAEEMYNGNMKEITSLYSDVATDTSYEDSWYARISSNAYSDGSNFYYMYDSSDQLSMMREFRELQNSTEGSDFSEEDFAALMEGADPTYKLVYHPITENDIKDGGADSDYTTLIEFNHEEEEESSDAEETADTEEGEGTTDTEEEGSVALVYNPGTNEMEENELLTELFAQYKDECDIYPSIKMTTALYDGKLYFNLSNCILSYDLESGAVEKVREYNTVYGKRDDTVAFGGMGFSVVDSAEEEALSVTNHPIAALTIKDDGQMYVSIATNYAFISGKSSVDDSSSYGYEFEESNYNPDYSTYMTGDSTQMEQAGYSEETNDNDEFMWSAVFVDTMDMTSTCSHTYESVTVEPTCGRDGFTENRCTKCGAAEADSRVVDEGSALDAHHYVHFDETYYTKADNGERNTGECYVCTVCGFAIEEPDEPRDDAEEEEIEEYEKEKAIWDNAVETAGHSYEPTDATWSEDSTSVTFSKLECSSVCPDRKAYLDCLLSDETISVECKETTAEAKVTGYEGECTTGTKVVYTATGETEDGYGYTVSHKVDQPAGEHSYEGTFHWTEIKDDEGNVTGYEDTVTADLECAVCGDKREGVEAVVEKTKNEPKCEEDGADVYTATATVKDDNGNVIGTATDKKEIKIDAIGHKWESEFTWTEIKDDEGNITGYDKTATATVTCANCGEKYENVEATVVLDEENSKAATCKEEGKDVYVATAVVKDDEGNEITTVTDTKEIILAADKHPYEGEFKWSKVVDEDTGEVTYTAKATLTCPVCGDEQKDVEAEVTYDDENSYAPKCEEEGKDVYVAVATAKDENGKVIGSATDTKEVTIAATGHDYGEWTTTKEPTYKNEGKKERTCSVCGDVDEEAIPVLEAKSIILSEEQLALEIGESATLTATCDPEAVDSTEIEWKSSDEKVATVKAGKVTGKKEGTATITASVGGKKATCKVSVTKAGVEYRTHVQTYGWQNWVSNGEMSGTTGESKRLEGIEIRLSDSKYEGSIQYRTHVQTYGWEKEWTADGEMSGTSGQAKRLEAIQIKLTGEIAEMYDVYYRVHAQTYGWLGWAKNGECAGTAGLSKRLEGIEIVLVKKGEDAPGSTEDEYITASGESNENLIRYQTHVQTYGWQDWKYDGVMSGITGQSKRLESIKIQLVDPKYEGSIQYKTHVQTYGWQDWVEEGDASGTTGEAKRLEAIQIKLTGEMADKYDIYYRVHAQTFGWLGWAKNGAKAGTAGYSKRLEGIEIVLVEKGGKAPGSTSGAYKEK